MTVEDRWNIILRCLRSTYMLALEGCVSHAGFDSGANHGKLQFGENSAHGEKCLRHGINFTVPAINRETAYNHQTETLFLDDGENNINAAAELGIKTLKVENGSDWRAALEEALKRY